MKGSGQPCATISTRSASAENNSEADLSVEGIAAPSKPIFLSVIYLSRIIYRTGQLPVPRLQE
jgi:hypothetical protein